MRACVGLNNSRGKKRPAQDRHPSTLSLSVPLRLPAARAIKGRCVGVWFAYAYAVDDVIMPRVVLQAPPVVAVKPYKRARNRNCETYIAPMGPIHRHRARDSYNRIHATAVNLVDASVFPSHSLLVLTHAHTRSETNSFTHPHEGPPSACGYP